MLSIRAGIVKSILEGKLTKDEIIQVIHFSGLYQTVMDFNKLKSIMPYLQDDPLYLNMNWEPKSYFKTNVNYIENYICKNVGSKNNYPTKLDTKMMFEKNIIEKQEMEKKLKTRILFMQSENISDVVTETVNYEQMTYLDFVNYINYRVKLTEKINSAISMLEQGLIPKSDEIIDVEFKKFNRNTTGMRFETKTINKLNELGFAIEPCKGMSAKMGDIEICGRPDGYITQGKYKNHYLEIKSIPYSRCKNNVIYQIATYYSVTKKPILLVTKEKGGLEFHAFTENELKNIWGKCSRELCKNSQALFKLININTIEKFDRLKKKMCKYYIYF
ncbi:MAG: hypothetical protein CMM93_07015 [Rickettsiales bacterium]|nr:hypothetical protein [Rickettsiales bacterium]|tara:strand:- start:98 stop:1090 length:993 start_codon:yes stop_codon:yes gene_type:complete